MGVVRNISNRARSLSFLKVVRVLDPHSQTTIKRLLLSEYARYRKDKTVILSGAFDLCVRVYGERYTLVKTVNLPAVPVVKALPAIPTIAESHVEEVVESPVEITADEVIDEVPAEVADEEIATLSPAQELKKLYEESGPKAAKIAYDKPALNIMCEALGLSIEGTKAEQIERIVQSLQ